MPIVLLSDPIIVPLPVYYGTSDTLNGRPVFPKTGLFLSKRRVDQDAGHGVGLRHVARFQASEGGCILLIIAVVVAVVLGVCTGVAIAATSNTRNSENFTNTEPHLGSKLYDIKGRLITEFFSDEKREIVSIKTCQST